MGADRRGRLRLVVAVADVGAPAEAAAGALESAIAQTEVEDEVVWVSGAPSPVAGARALRAAPSASRGDMYGAGLRWAIDQGFDIVAFTDASTRLGPGWRQALDAEVARGAVIVGGPVLPDAREGRDRTRRSWAGFLVDYAPHATKPFVSASGDVSANNVAYLVPVVQTRSAGPFWKTVVDRELRARGHEITVASSMVASSVRVYTVRDLLSRRTAGRLYASQTAVSWSLGRRALRVLLCGGLPAVRLVRLALVVRPDPVLRRALRRSAAFVVGSEIAWSIGEAQGYARPRPALEPAR